MQPLVLHLPLRIRNRVKTESYFYINMNEYRNAPYHELSDMKIKFAEAVQAQIAPLPQFDWVEFDYILFPGSAREIDTNNVCSIVDKFFCDAFVKAGKLPDDNYKYLRKSTFRFGEIDRNNARVELHITGQIRSEQVQLQALLDHNDFMAALDAYVRKAFPIPEGTTPSIDITAGRGDKGYSAVVSYASEGDTQPAASAATSAIAASLREQGNSVVRAGQPALPPAAEKALSEPAPAKPETVAEPAPKAMGGEIISDPAPKADAVFTKPEVVQEEAPAKPAVQPLFNFGG
jgi:hypothetical protein